MWFIIRMLDGLLYYVLATIIGAVSAGLLSPYSGQYEQNLQYMVSGSALAVVVLIFISSKIYRRYLCQDLKA